MVNIDSWIFVGVDGYVFALDKVTGAIQWESVLTGTLVNPTLIMPHPPTRSLVVGSGPNLRCLSAETGIQKWENKLKDIGLGYSSLALEHVANSAPTAPSKPAYSANQSPLPLEAFAFVGVNGKVRAIRLDDGADLWEFKTELLMGATQLPALLIEDGVLFIGGRKRVWAVDAFKGQELWCTVLPHGFKYHNLATMRSSPLSRPARFDPSSTSSYEVSKKSPLHDCLYVGANGYITPISKVDGSPVYLDNARLSEIVLKGVGYVFVESILLPSSDSALVGAGTNIRRISLNDGQMMWENTLQGMGVGNVSMIVGGGVSSGAEGIHDDLPSYSTVESEMGGVGSSSSSSSSSSTWHDRVFVAVAGKVHAVRITDGETLWKFSPKLMERAIKPMHLLADHEGNVFLGGHGYVVCLRADTGEQVWKSKSTHASFAIMSSYQTGNGETNRHCAFMTVARQYRDDE
ncbi:quinon protein alcohol dehydrogenase-like superfamily [Cladochytrium replicatum]|nr:quinon protein alcohol dehydrogenase-like superfamily [Cladochytrium replicatum]